MTPSSPYTRGRSFEYERVHFHRANGAFLAVRIAGSRGPWDVLALYPTRVVLEQCKRFPGVTPTMAFWKERTYLARFPVPQGVEANLVVRGERGLTRTFSIHAPTSPLSATTQHLIAGQPCQPTAPDATPNTCASRPPSPPIAPAP